MKTSKTQLFIGICLFLSLLSFPALAYPICLFDAKNLLGEADVVCRAKVVSVEPHSIELSSRSQPPLETEGAIAVVQVLSVIKGSAPATINVLFRKPSSWYSPIQLEPGENVILFLSSGQGGFRFVNEDDGKLDLPEHAALIYKSVSPEERMTDELIAASQDHDKTVRLFYTVQLSSFDSPKVVRYLNHLTTLPDKDIQGFALGALIKWGRIPSTAALSTFFRHPENVQQLKSSQAMPLYPTYLFFVSLNGYGDSRTSILEAMEDQFASVLDSAVRSSYEEPASESMPQGKRWKEFDIISFLRIALAYIPHDEEVIPDGEYCRSIANMLGDQIDTRGIAASLHHTFRQGSRSLAVSLLGNTDSQVSESAARAIDKMIVEEHTFPYGDF